MARNKEDSAEFQHLPSNEIGEAPNQGYSQPIGIATYQALRNIPQPYKTLAPVIDGVRKVLAEHGGETDSSHRRKPE